MPMFAEELVGQVNSRVVGARSGRVACHQGSCNGSPSCQLFGPESYLTQSMSVRADVGIYF